MGLLKNLARSIYSTGVGTAIGVANAAVGAAVLRNAGYRGYNVSEAATIAAAGNSLLGGGTALIQNFLCLNEEQTEEKRDAELFIDSMKDFYRIGNYIAGNLIGYGLLMHTATSTMTVGEVAADAAVGTAVFSIPLGLFCCLCISTVAAGLTSDQAPRSRIPHLNPPRAAEEKQPSQEDRVKELFLKRAPAHLRDYITSFQREKTIREQIAALNLTAEEEPLFKKFIDPITMDYMNLPVYLNDKFYDLTTLLKSYKHSTFVDPLNNIKFKPEHVQSGRLLLDELQEAKESLQKFREQNKVQIVIHREEPEPIANEAVDTALPPPPYEPSPSMGLR
jgi:hypothetical protein